MYAPFNLVDFIVSNEPTQDELCPVSVFDDESTLMQFTGLHYKNGKEIYEGDIVVGYDLDNERGVVEWDEIGWSPWSGNNRLTGIGFTETSEVIGNIYENPELLAQNIEDYAETTDMGDLDPEL